MFSQRIKVKEYTSVSIIGKSTKVLPKRIVTSPNAHSDLRINFLKFSTAMVKANTTCSSSLSSQAYDILLSALSLYGLLDYKQPQIRLKDAFRDKYRDFSKSGRTGELGQAINYIFAQEKLGFKFVVDFETFLAANSIAPKTTGGTPDYVLFGKANTNLAILESKGSSQKAELTMPQLRSKLQGAMDNQCQSGAGHLQTHGKMRVSNSYASVIEFAEALESRDSLVHFADPEYDEFKDDDYSSSVKDYYLRWLLFIGAKYDEANQENNVKLTLNSCELVQFEGMEFYIQNSSYSNEYLRIPVRYGISKAVFELFNTGDYHSLYYIDTQATYLENVEIFSDGTVAMFSSEI